MSAAQQARIPDPHRPWERVWMPTPVARPAGCGLPPEAPPVASRVDWVRSVLGKGGAWPVPGTLAEEQGGDGTGTEGGDEAEGREEG